MAKHAMELIGLSCASGKTELTGCSTEVELPHVYHASLEVSRRCKFLFGKSCSTNFLKHLGNRPDVTRHSLA